MERNKCWGTLRTSLLIAVASLTLAGGARASTYNVIHLFTWAKNPVGNLTFDAAGNLYGTTEEGGAGCPGAGCGAVWKLKSNSNGTWTVSILHAFKGADGAQPYAGLVFDTAGNLYGTTYDGGGSSCAGGAGCGVVFRLAPNPDGTWTESVLYRFTGGADGAEPVAGLILDAAGNLYGTTQLGGDSACGGGYGCGVAFKLASNPDGSWTESVLHSFMGGADGSGPDAGLVFDADGNLYGTAPEGGAYNQGVVFKLAPNTDETWTESALYSFTGGADGFFPVAGLIFDAADNLYGTTVYGGDPACGGGYGCGVAFKLAFNPDGIWTESVLHSFTGTDGDQPFAGLVFDAAGNLYGTTQFGGADGDGVVFKLTPTSSGWSETVLHSFLGFGKFPDAPVIFDRKGNLYGTASDGNHNFDYGLVFEIKP